MRVYTAKEIRIVEEIENRDATPFIELMENAGTACAERIADFIKERSSKVCIVCGKGKNGGDGFVIARKLFEAGFSVNVVLAYGEPVAEDAVEMYKKASPLGITMNDFTSQESTSAEAIFAADYIVDCVFGIGFHGEPDKDTARLFGLINESNAYKFAIDVPSGVNTDTGEASKDSVTVDTTLAITCLKPAHIVPPARNCCGVVEVLDIGISEQALDGVSTSIMTFEKAEMGNLLPIRGDLCHKNDFGHVLCIAGSMNMPGAACLCTNAALVTGAGLVTVAFPKSAYPSLASHTTEAMLCPLPETSDGFISEESLPVLLEKMEKATALVMGPGLGQTESVRKVVAEVLRNAKCPVVLDADGLNAIVGNTEILGEVDAPVIITPHPGEMSRLIGCKVSNTFSDRAKTAKEFADKFGVTVLLKGPATIVATPSSDEIYVNCTGNSGLAKGGSGDVLSGVIGALLAQHTDVFTAASLSAYLHGYAGDIAAAQSSKNGMVASDILTGIKEIYKEFGR